MPDVDKNKKADGDDEERIFKLYGEIEAEMMRLKRNPPKTVDGLVQVLSGTILSFLREMAHYQKEHTVMLYDLYDQVDGGGGEGTQFEPEHAQKFELVVSYAAAIARLALEQGGTLGDEEKKKHVDVLATAEECLKIIEDHTMVEAAEDEETDDGESN